MLFGSSSANPVSVMVLSLIASIFVLEHCKVERLSVRRGTLRLILRVVHQSKALTLEVREWNIQLE